MLNESTKNPQKMFHILVGVAIGTILSVAATVFYVHEKLSEINEEIAYINANQKISALTAAKATAINSTDKHFAKEVTNVIESFIKQKQDQVVSKRYEEYGQAQQDAVDGKWIYGNAKARVTIVEFSDFECPFCKKFHSTPKELVDASNGNINWQWMHMPLSFHEPAASSEAEAAECIADQKGNKGFWVAASEIFASTNGNGQGVPNIMDIAGDLGVNEDQFKSCMENGKFKTKVQQTAQKGSALGLNGTPAIILVDNASGKSTVLKGAQPIEAITAAIKNLMSVSQVSTPGNTEQ